MSLVYSNQSCPLTPFHHPFDSRMSVPLYTSEKLSPQIQLAPLSIISEIIANDKLSKAVSKLKEIEKDFLRFKTAFNRYPSINDEVSDDHLSIYSYLVSKMSALFSRSLPDQINFQIEAARSFKNDVKELKKYRQGDHDAEKWMMATNKALQEFDSFTLQIEQEKLSYWNILQKKWDLKLSLNPSKPLSYPIDRVKAKKWVEAHAPDI